MLTLFWNVKAVAGSFDIVAYFCAPFCIAWALPHCRIAVRLNAHLAAAYARLQVQLILAMNTLLFAPGESIPAGALVLVT